MSEPNQEPTMEEILASIRRIISEDDAPAEAPEAAAPQPLELDDDPPMVLEEPPAPPPAANTDVEEDEVLELTERVAPAETVGDIEAYAPQPEPEPRRAPELSAWKAPEEEPLLGRGAAESAASAFGQLAQTIAMPRDGRTLEDVVRELLKPLLKAWLDEHLPEIVQAKVEAEVERIARGPRR